MRNPRNLGIAGLAISALALMLASFSSLASDHDAACSKMADGVDTEWVQQERPTRQQQERPTRERQTQQREREQQQEQRQIHREPHMAEPIHRHELGRFNLREGMTIPQDGRTIGRIITAEDLGRSGLRFDGDDDCICMCNQDGCSPPGCGNCPVPLCPGGYVPPCPDGDSPLPDVYGVLDGLRELPPR
jgi:hypothetical protein